MTTKTRFVLIGGFLGAGKTTLISQLARYYVAAGKRVGIITNDQADNLVVTPPGPPSTNPSRASLDNSADCV